MFRYNDTHNTIYTSEKLKMTYKSVKRVIWTITKGMQYRSLSTLSHAEEPCNRLLK